MLLNVSRFISTLTCLCYTWVSSMSLVCSESMMSMSSCNEVLTSFNWTLDWKPSHFVTARTKYYLKHDLEEFSQLDRHARGNVCLFVLTKLILDIYTQIVKWLPAGLKRVSSWNTLVVYHLLVMIVSPPFCLNLFCSWLCFLQSLMSCLNPYRVCL